MVELLAHQGGWDEILMVAGPLTVFAGVLFLANRRANTKLAQRDPDPDEPDDGPDRHDPDGPDMAPGISSGDDAPQPGDADDPPPA